MSNNNSNLIQLYFEEVWNKGNVGLLDEIISENYINHSPGAPNSIPGPEGLKPIVTAIREGFPDLRFEIKNIVDAGDQVAVHTIMHGTNTGPLFGSSPTNKSVRVEQMQIERIENGKIVEHWRLTDELSMQKQLEG